ncbi:P27 family phage terminase small subunit [Paraburkholderia sp. Cpub6]|uniref:P27 family phage terminase small subunit n=1 Tax=Paraburkholderia sp. Cpub6 TaxID=2723094 RepID=UPI0016077F10|nr:P27 family phage terminase small subunit [Paraburkholderia sp. Cpub6]MBB5456895.1 P27 family predicted phage terminase small subunit [Paraburkholderia sp. Cpub6]
MGGRTSGRRAIGEPALRLMPAKPLPPPKTMSAEGKKVWREIVNSAPTDYFTAADSSLLAAYVAHAVMRERATAILDAEGPLIRIGRNRTPAVHPAVRIQAVAAGVMAALAVKLRLSKSSRTPRDAASTQMNAPRTARKPWDSGTKR